MWLNTSYACMQAFLTSLCMQGHKRGGVNWKRRWAIIKDDVLMFFEMKQDAIKQGWLQKKSSGAGTLGRSVLYSVCV